MGMALYVRNVANWKPNRTDLLRAMHGSVNIAMAGGHETIKALARRSLVFIGDSPINAWLMGRGMSL